MAPRWQSGHGRRTANLRALARMPFAPQETFKSRAQLVDEAREAWELLRLCSLKVKIWKVWKHWFNMILIRRRCLTSEVSKICFGQGPRSRMQIKIRKGNNLGTKTTKWRAKTFSKTQEQTQCMRVPRSTSSLTTQCSSYSFCHPNLLRCLLLWLHRSSTHYFGAGRTVFVSRSEASTVDAQCETSAHHTALNLVLILADDLSDLVLWYQPLCVLVTWYLRAFIICCRFHSVPSTQRGPAILVPGAEFQRS